MGRVTELLVGRDAELDRLDRVLEQAGAGTARAVFVTGEPGIGKTHVLAELVRRAERRGYLVLEGRAAEYEEELPFGVVVDALDAYVESLGRAVVDRLAADGLGELADVFPSLHGLRTAGRRAGHGRRALPLVLRGAGAAGAPGRRADRSCSCSTTCTGPTGRRPSSSATCCAASRTPASCWPAATAPGRRGGPWSPPSRRPTGPATSSGWSSVPLAPDDAGQLVPNTDASTRNRLYAQSGGNPFYLLQLARTSHNGRQRPAGGGRRHRPGGGRPLR